MFDSLSAGDWAELVISLIPKIMQGLTEESDFFAKETDRGTSLNNDTQEL
jgi:hypothetical protein